MRVACWKVGKVVVASAFFSLVFAVVGSLNGYKKDLSPNAIVYIT